MIQEIIIALAVKLVSWLYAKALAQISAEEQKNQASSSIDQRLQAVKDASKDAFDGKPITPEQRAKLRQAMSEFLRGDSSGGL